jgi:hypothetical protein
MMAKKTRPTFSAPSDKAAPRAAGSQWVYRSDATPAIAVTTTPPVSQRKTVTARRPVVAVADAPVAAPRHPRGVVNCAALLLFPVALVTGLILEPLAACCRRKTPRRAT